MKFSAIAAGLAVVAQAVAAPASGAGTAIPGGSPVELCDGDRSHDLVHISKLEISPNPPLPGQDLTIKASGTVDKTITDGAYAQVTVKLGLIRLLSQTFDLCEKSSEIDLKCPIENGQLSIQTTVSLPKEIPPATFNVLADAFSADDEQLTCLTATVNFANRGFSEDL